MAKLRSVGGNGYLMIQSENLNVQTYDIVMLTLGILFFFLAVGMFLFYEEMRINRVVYRCGHALTALFGIVSSCMIAMQENSLEDEGMRVVFLAFVLIVGLPILLYNLYFLISGEGVVLTSTLVNCSVTEIRSGRHRQRLSYRVEGTSLEGGKSSFKFQYGADYNDIRRSPVTGNTRIIVQYYSKSKSIYRVTRQDFNYVAG